jgi:hypothetical protein
MYVKYVAPFLFLLVIQCFCPVFYIISDAEADWLTYSGSDRTNTWQQGSSPPESSEGLTEAQLEFIDLHFRNPQKTRGYYNEQVYSSDPNTQYWTSVGSLLHEFPYSPDDMTNNYFGLDILYSESNSIISIPIARKFKKKYKFGTSIPFVRKTIDTDGIKAENVGLGDIPVYIKYLKKFSISSIMFSGMVKTPTGNPEADSGGVILPTGTGSWDYGLSSYIQAGSIGKKGHFATSIRMNTMGKFGDFKFRRGNIISFLAGYSEMNAEYDVVIYESLSCIVKDRSKIVIDGEYYTLDDSLKTMDLNIGIRWMSVFFEAIIPLFTEQDPSAESDQVRSLAAHVGFYSEL